MPTCLKQLNTTGCSFPLISCLASLMDSTASMLLNVSLLLILPALPGSAIESLLQCSFSSVCISGDLNYLSSIFTLLLTNPSNTSYLVILCSVYLVTAAHCWGKWSQWEQWGGGRLRWTFYRKNLLLLNAANNKEASLSDMLFQEPSKTSNTKVVW